MSRVSSVNSLLCAFFWLHQVISVKCLLNKRQEFSCDSFLLLFIDGSLLSRYWTFMQSFTTFHSAEFIRAIFDPLYTEKKRREKHNFNSKVFPNRFFLCISKTSYSPMSNDENFIFPVCSCKSWECSVSWFTFPYLSLLCTESDYWKREFLLHGIETYYPFAECCQLKLPHRVHPFVFTSISSYLLRMFRSFSDCKPEANFLQHHNCGTKKFSTWEGVKFSQLRVVHHDLRSLKICNEAVTRRRHNCLPCSPVRLPLV